MSKPIQIAEVLTANRLSDGLVVFLTADDSWAEEIEQATIASTKTDAKELESKGLAAEANNLVVGPYLIAVMEDNGRPRAAHIREHLRTRGPSVRPDLGRQALGDRDPCHR